MSPRRRWAVIAAVHPLASGAAQFNGSMVSALAEIGDVEVISWRRMYPPFLYRGESADTSAHRPVVVVDRSFLLSWHDPRSWRLATRRVAEHRPDAVLVPWLHPISAPPQRYLLKHAPKGAVRVVVCHNVLPHERIRGDAWLTRTTLRHADVIVTHAPHQREQLASIGLGAVPIVEAFHPRFSASDLAPVPSDGDRVAERRRHGDPDLLLLAFGAIRPYKGLDLALEAFTLLDPRLRVRLVIAGHSWGCMDELRSQAERLGVSSAVEFRDGFVSNEDAALLFNACDASLLPYRTASQSGVVQLSFAYGRPVVATRVGGLPAAVRDGVDGILCEPDDARALAVAIERMAREQALLAEGVRAGSESTSFARYCQLLDDALERLQR